MSDSDTTKHDPEDIFSESVEAKLHDDPLTWGEVYMIMDDVNFVRETLAIGDGTIPKLPKGRPGDAQRCVLAVALSNGWKASVDGEEILLRRPLDTGDKFDYSGVKEKLSKRFRSVRANRDDYDHYHVVAFGTPPHMHKLIAQFDAYLLPELILED